MRVAGVGTALAPRRVTAEMLAARGGARAPLLRAEVGLEARHEPERDVAPVTLAVDAARDALREASVKPGEADLVLVAARMRMEYLCWALSLAVQKDLGATRAVGVDLTEFTGPSLLAGLRVLSAKFAADPRLRTALLVAPHRWSDVAPAQREEDRWLWPLSDGAAALVVQRDGHGWELRGHAFATEGRGSMLLGIEQQVLDEGPNPGGFYDQQWAVAKSFTLRDEDAWRRDVEDRWSRLLPRVVGRAVERAGMRLGEVRIQAGFLYPRVAERASEHLGLPVHPHNAHGMMAGAELAFALREQQDEPVVLCGAGLPAHAGAMVFA